MQRVPNKLLVLCVLAALPGSSALAQEAPPPAENGVAKEDPQQRRKDRRRRLLRGVLDLATKAAQQQSDPAAGDASGQDKEDRDGEPPADKPSVPGLLEGLLPLLAPAAKKDQGQDVQSPIEPSKLNEVVAEEILRPLAEELEPVERLELRFDQQQTDFARDRLGLVGDVGLRSTPWGSPARLGLNIFARLQQQPQQATRAAITFNVDLRTDMVAMLNFVKQRALKKLYDTQRKRPLTDDEVALSHLLQTTPDFASLGDVADLIPRMGEINMRSINSEITRLRAEISGQNPVEVDKKLIDALAKAYKKRDNLLAFSIRSHRDSTLNVNEMAVILPGGGVSYQFVDLDSVEMHLMETGLTGQLQISVGQSGVLLYQGAKALVIEPTLRRLQQRDPRTIRNLRQRGRQLGQQLEELRGEPEEIETLPAPESN